MPGIVDDDAIRFCHVLNRAGSVHHVVDHGQTKIYCMVCLMSQSQVSASFEYSHLNMFTLDRQTCVRNRLNAFQVGYAVLAPTITMYGVSCI